MKKYFIASILSLIGFFIFSSFAEAQVSSQDVSQGLTTFASLITLFNTTVVKAVGTLFLSMAVVIFFYGVVEYIWGLRQGDSTKAKNGSQFMIWGLIALFVMFSVYGIIKFGQNILFNGRDVTSITIPDINIQTGGGGGTQTTGNNPLIPSSQSLICPDGVTRYNSPAEFNSVCPVFTCPDGVTKYYNQSDRSTMCR